MLAAKALPGSFETVTSAAAVTSRQFAFPALGLYVVIVGTPTIGCGNCHIALGSPSAIGFFTPSAPATPAFCAGAVPGGNVLIYRRWAFANSTAGSSWV